MPTDPGTITPSLGWEPGPQPASGREESQPEERPVPTGSASCPPQISLQLKGARGPGGRPGSVSKPPAASTTAGGSVLGWWEVAYSRSPQQSPHQVQDEEGASWEERGSQAGRWQSRSRLVPREARMNRSAGEGLRGWACGAWDSSPAAGHILRASRSLGGF